MASIKTSRGVLHYKPVNIYLAIKQIDREVAFENLQIHCEWQLFVMMTE